MRSFTTESRWQGKYVWGINILYFWRQGINIKSSKWGPWVTESVEHSALGFGSGHDLRVQGSSPTLGSAFSAESVWDSLSLSLCPSAVLPPQINFKN